MQSVVLEMMNELEENRKKTIDPLMSFIDFNDESYTERISDDSTSSMNNFLFN